MCISTQSSYRQKPSTDREPSPARSAFDCRGNMESTRTPSALRAAASRGRLAVRECHRLFPFNGPRGFARNIKADAIHAFDLIDDPAGKFLEQFGWQFNPICGHAVLGFNRAERNRIIVSALVAHH